MEKYFVIYNSDGDTRVTEMTKEKLLEAIKENYWGDRQALLNVPQADTNYWDGDILIIKGEVVVPEPKQIVTEYIIK